MTSEVINLIQRLAKQYPAIKAGGGEIDTDGLMEVIRLDSVKFTEQVTNGDMTAMGGL